MAPSWGHGEPYWLSLRLARYRLLEAVADEGFRERISKPLDEGTVTVDLTEEERVLLRAVDPKLFDELQEAWEECKDYELALRKMETFVRPCDVPPSREWGGLKDSLTEEQMRTPFAELRRSGELDEALTRTPGGKADDEGDE